MHLGGPRRRYEHVKGLHLTVEPFPDNLLTPTFVRPSFFSSLHSACSSLTLSPLLPRFTEIQAKHRRQTLREGARDVSSLLSSHTPSSPPFIFQRLTFSFFSYRSAYDESEEPVVDDHKTKSKL